MTLSRRALCALSTLVFLAACSGDLHSPTSPSALSRLDAARTGNAIDAGPGGIIIATGGTVTSEFLTASSPYTSDFYLAAPSFQYLGTGNVTAAGTIFDLGLFAADTELIFSIYVRNTGFSYYTGDGSRNPDGIEHASITDVGGGCAIVGFEDLYGGGDLDFDDIAIKVCQSTPTPPNAAPIAHAGGPYAGQEGTAITFDASGSTDPDADALTYDWAFGDGATQANAGAAPSHTYANDGSYTVTVTVHDGHGHSSSASASVLVTPVVVPPPPPTAAGLVDRIEDLVSSGAISSATAAPLLASAEAAAASLARGNGQSAAGQLNALINKIEAAQKSRKISAETAAALIAYIGQILIA